MPKISFSSSGNFGKMDKFLKTVSRPDKFSQLESLAQQGVRALAAATPKDSGETASLWSVEVTHSRGRYTIHWKNSHVVDGAPIAILLQYGHGTGTGGYVAGRDYINPAIKPVFDSIADKAWKVVTSA
ncbi:hypothetical protein SEA_ARGAN_24 [Arthrobacter phage Argan]|nr:hypothetical protein SEA_GANTCHERGOBLIN_24 [Arthrobacter phage GantcherGoblin]UVK62847.1 hypothetical protein SEA_UZUMAKI_25 [Arthrobacter phage Uzumaki]WNT45408.1 hypothetical protein SEA_ARGAN_24 [Arthrobacter phage Argan]